MRPFSLLIKPAGPDCNINCRYCFYSGKTCLFGEGRHRMSDAVLDTLVCNYMGMEFPMCSFAWQGGEPTLMGLEFFQKAVDLQKQYGYDGQIVSNALQTNGTLLDDAWGQFLREYDFLTGISLDGPEEYHDYYRKDYAGKGTFAKVMKGIEACRRTGAEYNILVLLNDKNVTAPDELWDFFVSLGVTYLQFVPCVEKDAATGEIAPYSITPEQYGAFLCRIFDRWKAYGPEKISVRIFDTMLSYIIQGSHTICTFGKRCNLYFVIEHTGDAYCCDFFVDEPYRLGNIMEHSFEELAKSPVRKEFANLKNRIDNKCFVCRYKDVCRGGCLKDRLMIDPEMQAASYFCGAYKTFFDYSLGPFTEIAVKLQQQHSGVK